jgi:hypothetical protein
MLKDNTTGLKFTLRKKTKPNPLTPLTTKEESCKTQSAFLASIQAKKALAQEPQPFPCNPRVFSKELDDSPHPSS